MKDIKIASLVQKLQQLAEWVDLAYLLRCINKGLRSTVLPRLARYLFYQPYYKLLCFMSIWIVYIFVDAKILEKLYKMLVIFWYKVQLKAFTILRTKIINF